MTTLMKVHVRNRPFPTITMNHDIVSGQCEYVALAYMTPELVFCQNWRH